MKKEDVCNMNMKVNADTMRKLKIVSGAMLMKYSGTLNILLSAKIEELKAEGKI